MHPDVVFRRVENWIDAGCHPSVAAVTIDWFFNWLPAGYTGAGLYASRLAPKLIAAILDPEFDCRDPDVRLSLQKRIDSQMFGNAMVGSGQLREIRRRLAESRPAPAGPRLAPGTPSAKVSIVVATTWATFVPGADVSPSDATFGITLTIRLDLVPPDAGGPGVLWSDQSARSSSSGLRPLESVSRDARAAVVSALDSLRASSGRFSEWRARVLSRRWRGLLNLELKAGNIAGDSAGLGIGVLLLGLALAPGFFSRGRRPNPQWCWTGALDPSGVVHSVDGLSLAAKVRAAAFAGFHGIVVPAGQLEDALRAIPLNARSFRVVGVENLLQCLEHPELWQSWFLPLWVEPWVRRAAIVASLLTIVVLAALQGLDATGWWRQRHAIDAQPTLGSNRFRLEVAKGPGYPARSFKSTAPYSNAIISRRFPGARRGRAILVFTTGVGPPGNGLIGGVDLQSGDTLWVHQLEDREFPLYPDVVAPQAFLNPLPSTLRAVNLDADPDDEFVMSISRHPYSSCFIAVVAPGKPVYSLYHGGHIEQVFVGDLDGDRQIEIVGAGIDNAHRGVALIVVRLQDMFAVGSPVGQALANAAQPNPWAGKARARPERCLFDLVVPLPEIVHREISTTEVRFDSLVVRAINSSESIISLDVGFDDRPNGTDFMINCYPREIVASVRSAREVQLAPPVQITANAVLGTHLASWRRAGYTPSDYSDAAFAASWRRSMMVASWVIP